MRGRGGVKVEGRGGGKDERGMGAGKDEEWKYKCTQTYNIHSRVPRNVQGQEG